MEANNMAAMRESLVKIREDAAFHTLGGAMNPWKIFEICESALSAPARNCDRPECATSKDAQNVWRKEDGGKTPYYEWLLAPAAERKGATA